MLVIARPVMTPKTSGGEGELLNSREKGEVAYDYCHDDGTNTRTSIQKYVLNQIEISIEH